MCHSLSSRTSQGGAIAVLHPRAIPESTKSLSIQGHILFQHNGDLSGETQAMFQRSDSNNSDPFPGCYVVIHHDGNLNATPSAGPAFCQFQLPPHESPACGWLRIDLRMPLELTVGGDGVIGRRVTIHADSGMDVIIAEGIIGWN